MLQPRSDLSPVSLGIAKSAKSPHHAWPYYCTWESFPMLYLRFSRSCPQEYLLTALLLILNGLFCQIPHCRQSPPPSPAIRLVSKVPSVTIQSPRPPEVHQSHSSMYLSIPASIPLSWPTGWPVCLPTVWLHISPLLCFVRVGFLATDNSHDRAPGQRKPLASQQPSSGQSGWYSQPQLVCAVS